MIYEKCGCCKNSKSEEIIYDNMSTKEKEADLSGKCRRYSADVVSASGSKAGL